MSSFLVRAAARPAASAAVVGGTLMKADRRTEFGPSSIGDPSIPGNDTLTTWGTPLRQVIPVIDPGVPLVSNRSTFNLGGLDPLYVWRTQPSVRKVVDYIARNVAAVPWHVYQRADDDDRQRKAASPAEQALRQPARFLSGYRLWHDVIVDSCLYDAWCVALLKLDGDTTERLYRIPPKQLILEPGNLGTIGRVGIRVSPSLVLDITDQPLALGAGWADRWSSGVSPMTTLAAILTEQAEAVQWRRTKWAQQPKVSGLLTRPLEAPAWESTQRDAFLATWRSWRDGTAQGTPILEDGMGYDVLDGLNPADAKDIEGRQLTDAEVSSAFHIAPELVGARAGSFSTVAAYRQMLYGPALGPRFTELEQAVNAPEGIIAFLDDTPDLYAEMDRSSALNGSFAEQAQILSTATGGPYMLRSEARGALNLPKIEGADELVVPLNVTQGGQASPSDSGSQNTDPNAEPTQPAPSDTAPAKALLASRVVAKAAGPSSSERDELRDIVAEQFRKMTLDVTGPVDAQAFHDAWDGAVKAAIHPHLTAAAEANAHRVLKALDAPEDAWSAAVMANYLDAMADTHAGRMVKHVAEAASAPEAHEDHTAFVVAVAASAGVLAFTALADAAGFGAHDAAHASKADTKTWNTGAHPRATHAAMDGETVKYAERFSNGLDWPGDSRGDAEQTAGCNCGVTYSREP